MKEKVSYIILRANGGNAFHRRGDEVRRKGRVVCIGEHPDCDVRYESRGLEPEYYAAIIREQDGGGWRIVSRSQHVRASIAGKGDIGYAQQLEDGDIISFEGCDMSLLFSARNDDRFDDTGKTSRKWLWGLTAVLGAAILLTTLLLPRGKEEISAADMEGLEESVFILRVDSVQQIMTAGGKETILRPTKRLTDDAPMGTAFLTTDSVIVTARHCVEYWLGRELDLTARVEDMDDSDIVRWAIETETFNQTHDADSVMTLRTFFSLRDFTGEPRHSFASTDKRVRASRSHDGVFQLADFSEDYYWRSIRPYFEDREMMLGDILWIEGMGEGGKVRLATPEEVASLARGDRMMVCGYPMTGMSERQMAYTKATAVRKATPESEALFFESNINHGFSGGPVLRKTDKGIAAVGVVSRVDSVSSGLYKWAVPVTEINKGKGSQNE